jgi:hypothetical protein
MCRHPIHGAKAWGKVSLRFGEAHRSTLGTARKRLVKLIKSTLFRISGALALVLAASAATADPLVPSVDTLADGQTGATQNFLVGSDTLDAVMVELIDTLNLTQITSYRGLGSSAGERYLEGSPTGTDPSCTNLAGATDANGGFPDGNPGCEEIAPMSRPTDNSICEDEQSTGDPATNQTAEMLAVCIDAIVVLTDNKAHRQYADSAASCPAGTGADPSVPLSDNPLGDGSVNNPTYAATGALRSAGTIGGYTLSGWQDVLRLIYAGCRNNEGTCAAVPRLTRCSAASNPTRQALVDSWATIFKSGAQPAVDGTSVDCPEGNCCSQLRQAYRRDDSSGTTVVFLDFLGLASAAANLPVRARVITTLGACVAPSESHIFCDGGDLESFFPAPSGDPITRACAAEDDLCRSDGTSGIVRAIRSPREGGFPAVQCTKNRFAKVTFLNTNSCAVCPDGKFPNGGLCWAPYYAVDRNGDGDNTDVGDREYNCLNGRDSLPPGAAGNLDGRAFNYCVRNSVTGVCETIPNNANVFEVASWRQNMAALRTATLSYPGGPFLTTQTVSCPVSGGGSASRSYPGGVVCQNGSATEIISCLTANTHCTLGWAAREAAVEAPYDDRQEAVRVNAFEADDPGYPMRRPLYLSAIGGFENITADCLDRGGSAALCADQLAIAQSFFDMDANARAACTNAGFLLNPDNGGASICVSSVATSGCGATDNDCTPN